MQEPASPRPPRSLTLWPRRRLQLQDRARERGAAGCGQPASHGAPPPSLHLGRAPRRGPASPRATSFCLPPPPFPPSREKGSGLRLPLPGNRTGCQGREEPHRSCLMRGRRLRLQATPRLVRAPIALALGLQPRYACGGARRGPRISRTWALSVPHWKRSSVDDLTRTHSRAAQGPRARHRRPRAPARSSHCRR